MAKYTKTWKIGEYCKGGVITTETKGTKIAIIGKDWDFSTGSRRSSNQKNAKEWCRLELDTSDKYKDNLREVQNFVNDITSSYYTEQIIKWFEAKGVEISNCIW